MLLFRGFRVRFGSSVLSAVVARWGWFLPASCLVLLLVSFPSLFSRSRDCYCAHGDLLGVSVPFGLLFSLFLGRFLLFSLFSLVFVSGPHRLSVWLAWFRWFRSGCLVCRRWFEFDPR